MKNKCDYFFPKVSANITIDKNCHISGEEWLKWSNYIEIIPTYIMMKDNGDNNRIKEIIITMIIV